MASNFETTFGFDTGAVEWSSWSGRSYTCVPCYQRSMTATATTTTTRSVQQRDVPIGTKCAMCEISLGGQKLV